MSLNNLRGYWKPPWTVSGPGVLQPDRPTLLTVGSEDFGFIEVVRLHDEASQRKIANAIAALPELLETLEEVKALIADPFDGHSNFASDKLKAVGVLCDRALNNAKGGEA